MADEPRDFDSWRDRYESRPSRLELAAWVAIPVAAAVAVWWFA